MENFKQELQKQTKLLIEEIKKVCNEIYEKAGGLDGFDIQINTHDNEKDILPFGRPSDYGGMCAQGDDFGICGQNDT